MFYETWALVETNNYLKRIGSFLKKGSSSDAVLFNFFIFCSFSTDDKTVKDWFSNVQNAIRMDYESWSFIKRKNIFKGIGRFL